MLPHKELHSSLRVATRILCRRLAKLATFGVFGNVVVIPWHSAAGHRRALSNGLRLVHRISRHRLADWQQVKTLGQP